MNNSASIPSELKGMKDFVQSHTQRSSERTELTHISDFQGFIALYKLPAQHSSLQQLLELGEEAGEWWADACLRQAQQGATFEQLQRLLHAAVDCGADSDHFKIHRATKLVKDRLINRLADDVLQKAQKRFQNDKAMAERTPNPKPGSSSRLADEIEDDIKKAGSQGVPLNDKRLEQARGLAAELRQLDGVRKRMANREARLSSNAKAVKIA